MGRTFETERHPRRFEIDFCLANGAPMTAVSAFFDIDRKTVASYRHRMLEESPSYFDKLAVPSLHYISLSPEIFRIAATYADAHRRPLDGPGQSL